MLNCDYFSVSNALSQKGSVGSCSMIALELFNVILKQRSALWTVSLTSSDHFTNHIPDYLIPDVMKEATDGYMGEIP